MEEGNREVPSLGLVKAALLCSYHECTERGLQYSANWYLARPQLGSSLQYTPCRAIELASSIEDDGAPDLLSPSRSPQFQAELCQYYYALSLHRLGEYQRAAHTLEHCNSPEAFFLHCYSLYLVPFNAHTHTFMHQFIPACTTT